MTGLTITGRAQPPRPEPPEIDRVSIDTADNLPVIYWNASTSEEVEKYTLFYYFTDTEGQWYPKAYDTVNAETFQYTYNKAGLPEDSLSLTVQAINAFNQPSLTPDPHTTMHLSAVYDSCSSTMELSWTPYLGWDNLVRYEVFAKTGNDPFVKIGEVDSGSLGFSHGPVADNHRYCYLLEAVRNDNTRSLSNKLCRDVFHPLHPQYIDAEYASVDEGGGNVINLAFYIDPSGEVEDFSLLRARPGSPYTEIETFTGVNGSQLTYSDPVIGTDRRYLYRLYSLDVCDNPVTGSNTAGNIVLTARPAGLQSILQWNPYEEYEAGVKSYNVYRIINQEETELIRSMDPSDTSYTDNLGSVTGTRIQDNVCYYVVAEENDNYSRGEKGYSSSNTVCISVVPEILMANAFTPNDDLINDEIRPALTFIPEKYLFQVFDRWGSMIFETTDPLAAWDGRVKGNAKAPEGVFIYHIRLTTTSGIEVEQTGQITVFYP